LAVQVDLTVIVLLHCVSFTNARDNCFCVRRTLTFISELFSKVASRSIID